MKKKIFAPTLYPLDRDISKVWFVMYRDKAGRLIRVYGKMSHFPTAKERKKEAERIINKILEPDMYAEVRRDDLIGQLSNLIDYKKPSIKKTSYQSYQHIIKSFSEWFRAAHKKDKRIMPSDFIMHLHSTGCHKNTTRNKLIVLSGLCKELVKAGQQTKNPFEGFTSKRVKATSKLPFAPQQVAQLKQYISTNDAQLWSAIEFMYYLFLRPKEIRLLKIGDILFEVWKLALSGDIAKDGDTIYKTIPEAFRAAILLYKDYPVHYYIFGKTGVPGEKVLSRDALSKRHKSILKLLNFSSRYAFYSWVHTGIKIAALSDIPIKELQLQKGHHDLNMFNQYLKDLGVDDCVKLTTNFPAL